MHQMRAKVIAFRDYYDRGAFAYSPMDVSRFFDVPQEIPQFEQHVQALQACGGKRMAKSALEVLHLAFRSDWNVNLKISRRRQFIFLFTDAAAHWLNDPRRYCSSLHDGAYPSEDMPMSLGELAEEYCSPQVFPGGYGDELRHRWMFLFVPGYLYPWNEMGMWENVRWESIEDDMDTMFHMPLGFE